MDSQDWLTSYWNVCIKFNHCGDIKYLKQIKYINHVFKNINKIYLPRFF